MALVKIRTANTSLTIDQNQTYLSTDHAAGVSALTVKNITGFAANQILILGFLGNQGSEIIKTHAVTAPSGSTITLASATVFPHSSSTYVTVINYDQVEISTAATVAGSKTVLTTTNIVADNESTNYNDVALSTGYYFARFKNTLSGNFSGYSDPIPVTGYTMLSARSIIDSALGDINKKTSEVLSDIYAFQQIDNCQQECVRDLKRWSFMQMFDQNIGQLTTGSWKVALPDDIDDENTTKSVYNFKIGNGSNLYWVDKEKWNEITQGISHTTLANNITLAATSIVLTDSSNLNDTGTVTIGANNYTYTANNRSTNTLTIPSSATTNTAGADVFQGASTGTPQYWTTFGGYAYFYPVLDATLNNRDAYMDYYKKLERTTSDTDTIVIPDPTVVQYYLIWKFLLKLASGVSSKATEASYTKYVARKAKMIQKESMNRTFQMRPLLNKFNMSSADSRAQRLGNFNPPN